VINIANERQGDIIWPTYSVTNGANMDVKAIYMAHILSRRYNMAHKL
jgi:hypothetical protein